MDKGPDAFRTISEVAEDLDLPQHVLRFWETRFPQIRPLKRGGGRRYYRPDDIDLLRGIRHLLYGEGYTIRGVQRILKDEGLKFVQAAWRNAAEDAAAASRARAIARAELNGNDDDHAAQPAPEPGGRGGLLGLLPKLAGREAEAPPLPRQVDLPRPARGESEPTFPFRPAEAPAARQPAERQTDERKPAERLPAERLPAERPPSELKDRPPRLRLKSLDPVHDELPVPDELRSAQAYAPPAMRGAIDAGHPGAPLGQRLSREDVRRLQATLYELQECRRLLDQALAVPRSGR